VVNLNKKKMSKDILKASWTNKDGYRITIEAPDFELEKLHEKVKYYNRNSNEVHYSCKNKEDE